MIRQREFLVTAFGDRIHRPPEMRAIAVVAQNAYAPDVDIAIDAVLQGIDLERQQLFTLLIYSPRPLVHLFRPGRHTREVAPFKAQQTRPEFDVEIAGGILQRAVCGQEGVECASCIALERRLCRRPVVTFHHLLAPSNLAPGALRGTISGGA